VKTDNHDEHNPAGRDGQTHRRDSTTEQTMTAVTTLSPKLPRTMDKSVDNETWWAASSDCATGHGPIVRSAPRSSTERPVHLIRVHTGSTSHRRIRTSRARPGQLEPAGWSRTE